MEKKKNMIVIEVDGGVADVTSNPDNIPIKIIDHDSGETTIYLADETEGE